MSTELFNQIRKNAGVRLSAAVSAMLVHVSKDLGSAAARATDDAAARALGQAASQLLAEREARAERAAAVFDELNFKALQEGRFSAPDSVIATARGAAGYGTLSDLELSEQVLAQDLAARARELIEQDFPYPVYLARLSDLLGETVGDDGSALSAKGIALSVVGALRPFPGDRLVHGALGSAVVRHCAQPVRQIVASIDEQLIEAGLAGMRLPFATNPTLKDVRQTRVAAPGEAAPAPAASTAGTGQAPVRRTVSASASVKVSSSGDAPAKISREAPGPETIVAMAEGAEVIELSDTGPAVPEATVERPSGEYVGPGSRPASAHALAPAPKSPTAAPVSPSPSAESVGEKVISTAVERLIEGTRSAEVLGRHPIAGKARAMGGIRQARLLPSIESFDKDAIAYAHQAGVTPFSAEARRSFFSRLRSQMRESNVDAAQLVVVDLVAAMFDYATDDARIPEPVKPLLWRLQMPTVTLACLDPGYLSEDDRSMRSLVEHVAAISIAYPEEITRDSELFRRLQTLVRAAEVVAHAFQVRSKVLSDRVDIEYQRATYGMGQLVSKVSRERKELDATAGRRNRRDYRRRPSREREAQVTELIDGLIAARVDGRKVPESVREFLKDVWVRHLRTAVLRDGESSAGFKVALSVVDDLLWTIDGGGSRRSRSELAERIPAILGVLTQGITDIGAKADDYRPFFDEMFLIHLRRMQKRRASRVEPTTRDELPVLSEQVAGKPAAPEVEPVAGPVAEPSSKPAESPIRKGDDGIDVLDVNLDRARRLEVPRDSLGRPTGSPAPRQEIPRAAELAVPSAIASAADQKAAQTREESDSESRLRKLIDETSLADAPTKPKRRKMTAPELTDELKVGDWIEMVTSTRKLILAKVAWINERRSVVLLLQHPDRLILSRHLSALAERAARGRAFLVS